MNKKSIYYGILFSLFMSSLIFFMGYTYDRLKNTPKELYQVYLDGKVVGIINNDNELYDLIDKEQEALKTDFKVDKIYPPNSLEVSKIVTYKDETVPVKDIYEKIKNVEPFTVKGYEVIIEKEAEQTSEETETEKETLVINILDKEIFNTAINSVVRVFVDENTYQAYLNGTQETEFEEGTILEKVSIEEKIKIREKYISTEEKLYTNVEDLSRYILFGAEETGETYTIKSGDTIKSVAMSNRLNIAELLIVNPDIKGESTLLFPGQVVNVGLINPLITVVTESTVVENQEIKYETQVEYDTNMSYGMTKVKQAGVTGLSKVTYRKETKNGFNTSVVKIKDEELAPAVEEIIIKGGHNVVYVGDSTYWAWPTLKPYVITSLREWRWGRWHAAIDISGTGHGSPIFTIQNGTVDKMGYGHSTMGNYIYINHHNGYFSSYLHLSEIFVSNGQTVNKGDIIGTMGNTGESTGTHLHFGVFYTESDPRDGVNDIDPLSLYN